jgi:hypothetical protein
MPHVHRARIYHTQEIWQLSFAQASRVLLRNGGMGQSGVLMRKQPAAPQLARSLR